MSNTYSRNGASLALLLAALCLFGCGGAGEETGGSAGGLTGGVAVDGSSTVFPITEAVAEEFRAVEPKVRVTVGISGTGGGFKKFVVGETDINDASRPIKPSEQLRAASNSIEFVELPVAFDGISVVVNPENDWVDSLTVDELHRIWQPESAVKLWSDVRPEWPQEAIALYAPGTDSGTFDYFTEAINGEGGASRSDFTASEDDNVIVHGVAGDRNALGYFGYAYYVENQDRIRVVPIDGGSGPVAPSEETINDGSYAPLSRPIFIYVSKVAAARPEVKAFVDFYLDEAANLVHEVGYVALPEGAYDVARKRFSLLTTGTVYGGDVAGASIEALFDPSSG